MNDTQESLDLTVLEHLDFQPACQGKEHGNGGTGHNPESPASYFQISPCGREMFKCAENVAYLRKFDYANCGCGARHRMSAHRFIPL